MFERKLKKLNSKKKKFFSNFFLCWFFLILIVILNVPFPFGKSVSIDMEYNDLCILGLDVAVEGLSWSIYDITDLYNQFEVATGTTQANGLISFSSLEGIQYELRYQWNGVMVKYEFVSADTPIEIELSGKFMQAFYKWNLVPLIPAENVEIDLFIYDGVEFVFLASMLTDFEGKVRFEGLPIGEYMLEGDIESWILSQALGGKSISEILLEPIKVLQLGKFLRFSLFQ